MWGISHHAYAKDALLHAFVIFILSLKDFKFATKQLTVL
jgi:hypothetical protein